MIIDIKYSLQKAILVMVIICLTFSCSIQKPVKGKANNSNSPTSGLLYNQIAHLDTLVFDAFNKRDINELKKYFSASLEVYQDNTGLRNYNETIQAFTGLFKSENVLTRTIVPGSMEVYPIKDYGAIQTGLHTFSHIENGKLQAATFKFMHIWLKRDGIWQITRIITYGHPEAWK